MNGSVELDVNPPDRAPLELVRRLYDAWNAGDVAGAAALLSPDVRWQSFGASPPADVPEGLQATLAGGSSGGTSTLSPVTLELLVCVVDHVIAFSRRRHAGDAEVERLEVWTVREARAVHYRGYPLEDGLAVLSQTTGSRRLEAVCRGMLALNRGDAEGWVRLLEPQLWPDQRLDDVQIIAESTNALVISAVQHLHDASRGPRSAEPLNLVIEFEGDRARRVTGHAALADALSDAAGTRA
jgi:ketosteroid isomerase-like protein